MSHLDDSARRSQLLDLLRHLATRIQELDRRGALLDGATGLEHLLETAHDHLARHDALRLDSAAADAWRIVEEARRGSLTFDHSGDDLPWLRPQAE